MGGCQNYGPFFGSGLNIIRPSIFKLVNIRVPFRVLIIIRHLIFRVPKKAPLIFGNSHMSPKP